MDHAADHLGRIAAPRPAHAISGDLRLSLFATIAQFGTPEDVALEEIKVELFFPADAATTQALRALT
ncbi:MAG: hypothetical protein AAF822_02330 [Pseudomonadota bacterium]